MNEVSKKISHLLIRDKSIRSKIIRTNGREKVIVECLNNENVEKTTGIEIKI